ncbi:hypothetical protein GGTG_07821 [Gaeumannomyces tritici R3-111a-1]|uniref:Uncharacterized protein n=1 Tax=Gaeumannomyces tritici (strain R3-111a-1) TaxID=644352 RepID=J3P2S8_GAET3|nr:hypothetical protein GGTG_07821 [Gaeumannomyces tritici R3-111a-1]EJT73970.1 hypothetical protein GGTG_07821 [Gaeumannomyces tritici R3-111a-1]
MNTTRATVGQPTTESSGRPPAIANQVLVRPDSQPRAPWHVLRMQSRALTMLGLQRTANRSPPALDSVWRSAKTSRPIMVILLETLELEGRLLAPERDTRHREAPTRDADRCGYPALFQRVRPSAAGHAYPSTPAPCGTLVRSSGGRILELECGAHALCSPPEGAPAGGSTSFSPGSLLARCFSTLALTPSHGPSSPIASLRLRLPGTNQHPPHHERHILEMAVLNGGSPRTDLPQILPASAYGPSEGKDVHAAHHRRASSALCTAALWASLPDGPLPIARIQPLAALSLPPEISGLGPSNQCWFRPPSPVFRYHYYQARVAPLRKHQRTWSTDLSGATARRPMGTRRPHPHVYAFLAFEHPTRADEDQAITQRAQLPLWALAAAAPYSPRYRQPDPGIFQQPR